MKNTRKAFLSILAFIFSLVLLVSCQAGPNTGNGNSSKSSGGKDPFIVSGFGTPDEVPGLTPIYYLSQTIATTNPNQAQNYINLAMGLTNVLVIVQNGNNYTSTTAVNYFEVNILDNNSIIASAIVTDSLVNSFKTVTNIFPFTGNVVQAGDSILIQINSGVDTVYGNDGGNFNSVFVAAAFTN